MDRYLRTTTLPMPEMIVAIETIEKQAQEAPQQGKSLNEACPYPFSTEAGRHFKAVYLQAVAARTTIPTAQQR